MSVARTHHYVPYHRFVTTTELAGTRYDTGTVDRFTQAIIYVNETLWLTSSRVLKDYLTFTATEHMNPSYMDTLLLFVALFVLFIKVSYE